MASKSRALITAHASVSYSTSFINATRALSTSNSTGETASGPQTREYGENPIAVLDKALPALVLVQHSTKNAN